MWNPFHRELTITVKLDPAQMEIIMSGLSDLQAFVTADTTATQANTAAVQAAVTALGATGDSDAAVAAAVTSLQANEAQRATDTASLQAATPAPAA